MGDFQGTLQYPVVKSASYIGELGIVEMVVTVEMQGPPAWHLQSSPVGGIMLVIPSFGRVFVERTSAGGPKP